MALELIVNLLLIAGGIFCFVNVSTTMPHSAVNELGAEQWPQAILVLMLIALAFNVIRFFKIRYRGSLQGFLSCHRPLCQEQAFPRHGAGGDHGADV